MDDKSSQEALIGFVPYNWQIKPLMHFLSRITYGFTNPMPDTKAGPWKITAKDVINGSINYETARHTCHEDFESLLTSKSKPNVGDILLTKDATIGRVAVVDRENICINQSVALLQPNHEIIPYFLKYLLESPFYQKLIENDAHGTTIKHVYITKIDKMKIAVPPLKQQKVIVNILRSLDDKIELNRRMNQTLEQMAQDLFNHYFVDNIDPDNLPEGWKRGRLGDYIETISKTHKFPKPTIIFLNTSDILDGKVLHRDYRLVAELPGQAKKSIKTNDILFSEIRPANKRFAFINFDSEDYVVSTKLMVLRSKTDIDSLFFYFLLTRNETLSHLQNIAESRSGTFPQITFDQLKEIEFNIPCDDFLKTFTNESLQPLYQMIFNNDKEIKTLSLLRDTLLPKLMSGEIDVGALMKKEKQQIENLETV
jgi:type I restriction enzyme S subunit